MEKSLNINIKSSSDEFTDTEGYYEISTFNEDIILTPKEGYVATLIWLPGLKDNALSYLPDILNHKGRFIPNKVKINILTAPRAIKSDPIKPWSWYQTIDRSKFLVGQYEDNIDRICNIIDKEAKLLNNDYKKIFLGGFSQGSLMTLLIGLSIENKKTLGGLVCCSGYLSSNTKLRLDEDIKKMPILICQGDKDERITKDFAYKSQQILFNENFNIEYKTYNIAHELTWEEYKDIKEFIHKRIS